MDITQIIYALVTAVITGGVSALATVKALRVHIQYLRETIDRHELSLTRAHDRITKIESYCPRLHEGKPL